MIFYLNPTLRELPDNVIGISGSIFEPKRDKTIQNPIFEARFKLSFSR